MKKLIIFAGICVYATINYVHAQVPAAIDASNFPKDGDSIVIHTYNIPPTETFKDDNPTNDSLSIDRAIEKALEGAGDNAMMGIATAGPGQTWNVSTYLYAGDPKSKKVLRKYFKPDTKTPGSNSFSNANLYYSFTGTASNQPYTSYGYFKKDSTGFYDVGSYTQAAANITVKSNIPKPYVKFPLDYNNPKNVVKQKIIVSGSLPVVSWYDVTVDAYGTVVLDTGKFPVSAIATYSDCIRTITEEKDTFTLDGIGISGGRMYTHTKLYSYYVKGIFEPVVTYSFTKIRNNIDPQLWKQPQLQDLVWRDEFQMTFADYNYKSIIGIEEKEKENHSISIAPNPSSGKFNMSFLNTVDKPIKIEVYDMLGQLIYQEMSQDINVGIKTIDLSNQNKGIYLMRLAKDDEIITKKIIIN